MSRFHGCGQTYFQAAATCKNRGGKLFLPRSEDETQKVKENLLNQFMFKKWSSSRSGYGRQLQKTLDRRQTGKSHLSAWMVWLITVDHFAISVAKVNFPPPFRSAGWEISCPKFSGGRTGVEIILPGPISRWGYDFKDYFMYFSSSSQIQIFKIPQKTRWVKNLSSN